MLATYMAGNKQEYLGFRNMLGLSVNYHGLGYIRSLLYLDILRNSSHKSLIKLPSRRHRTLLNLNYCFSRMDLQPREESVAKPE